METTNINRIQLIIVIILFSITILFVTLNENKNKNKVKKIYESKISGIVISKKDVQRGDFNILLKLENEEKEITFSGYDNYFHNIFLGDSIIKQSNSLKFEIFRKSENDKWQYIFAIENSVR